MDPDFDPLDKQAGSIVFPMGSLASYDDEDDDEILLGLDGSPAVRALVEDNSNNFAATTKRNKRVLVVAFVSFFLFAVAEILGGIFGHSLALASDAATMVVDAITYLLNLFAEHKKVKASPRGVLLYELVSPSFSVVALLATTVYILVEAVSELQSDPGEGDEPNIVVMWFFVLLNLAIDIVNVFLFMRERRRKSATETTNEGGPKSNANMLSALTHVSIDTMRTLSVFMALIANKLLGLTPTEADAYSSICIAILTFFSTIPLFRLLRRKQLALKKLASASPSDSTA